MKFAGLKPYCSGQSPRRIVHLVSDTNKQGLDLVNCSEIYDKLDEYKLQKIEEIKKLATEKGLPKPGLYIPPNKRNGPTMQRGGKSDYIKLIYDKYTPETLPVVDKIVSKYYLVDVKQLISVKRKLNQDKIVKYEYLVYKYSYLDPTFVNPAFHKLFNKVDLSRTVLDSINDKIVLYYKINNLSILLLWELNYKYALIKPSYKYLYEINNMYSIANGITYINDHFFANEPKKIISFNLSYLTSEPKLNQDIIDDQTKQYNKDFLLAKYIHNMNNYDELMNQLNQIEQIDFLYLELFPFTFIISNQVRWAIMYMYYTSIFMKVIDKISRDGTLCIKINMVRNDIQARFVTIFCYFFEEYYLVNPEIANYSNPVDVFLILKNKKNISSDSSAILSKLLKKSSYLGINLKYMTADSVKVLYDNRSPLQDSEYLNYPVQQSFITNIKFKNPDIKRLYKLLKTQIYEFNRTYMVNDCRNRQLVLELYERGEKGLISPEEEQTMIERNLFECLQWSNKYKMPIKDKNNFTSFKNKMRRNIFTEFVSYEEDVLYKFKPIKDDSELLFIDQDSNIDFKYMPDYYTDALVKFNYETRAYDGRDLYILHQVKKRTDYYWHRLTKIISHKFKIQNDYISQAWIKMTEMLHVLPLIPKSKTSIKTFHFCELPGAFINAIKHFIASETKVANIKRDWTWTAESLNPNQMSKEDARKAFGDEANMLKKYPDNYDFGPKMTGDITDPANLRYYFKNYPDNDLVTNDGGLAGNQHDLSYILGFAIYLTVFGCTKIGGNAIIKRYFPISNNQELYMLYTWNNLFGETLVYKPRVNYQSEEYYLVGLNYKGIDASLLDCFMNFLKNYKLIGFSNDIPDSFLLQANKIQHKLLDNFNRMIRKKIYFVDNFTKLTKSDWSAIDDASSDKIEEWLEKVPIKPIYYSGGYFK